MATITQSSEYKTVTGWYGKCTYESSGEYRECEDLPLSTLKSYVSSVYQWTTNGVLKAWKHNLPDTINSRVFNKLECGKLYYMTIKPSTSGSISQFQIPNFTVSSYEDESMGLLTDVCDLPDPTPTPFDCICAPDDYLQLNINSNEVSFNSHIFSNFSIGSVIYYDDSKFGSAVGSYIILKFPNNSVAGVIEFTSVKPENCDFYLKYGNRCYKATATDTNVNSSGIWELTMSQTEILPDACGESIEPPTPTPEPIPTPTPEPIPTPTPIECDCILDDRFTKVNINSQSGTQANFHNFVNFDVGNVIYYDESSLSNSSASVCLVNYIGHSLQSSIEFTGKKPSGSTRIFIKRGNECYAGDVVSKTGFYQCDVRLTDTLDNTCGDKSKFPTPTPVIQPTPTPVKPTPTPVKPTNWSKPNTHTEINTEGGSDEVLYKITSEGLDYVVFTFRGFATNGKLYVDLTFKNGSFNTGDVEQFETTRTVYIKDTGRAIGAVKKLYQNGVDKATIYYLDPASGDVYKGDIIEGESKVWMEFAGKKDVNQVCCPNSHETMDITNGNSTTTNQITVNAIASGEMDGKLCWPTLDGFASPTSYIVKFEGLDQSEETIQAIMISTTIKVTDVTFRYEHKFGQCYEGKLDSENVIFKKV
jgi:hypothetical protein